MRVKRTRKAERWMGRAGGWLAGGSVLLLMMAGGGCLQLLGDDGTFVLGTGGAGGESGGAGPGGNGGGTAGAGATGGGGTTTTGVCSPEETRSCYSGPDGTEGVGECKAGVETCAGDGSGWGECQGEVTPKAEDPTVVGDEACDGYLPGEPVWSKIFGDQDAQIGTFVTVSPLDGSIYLTGIVTGNLDLGNGVVLNNTESHNQPFLAKLAPNGSVLWANKIVVADTFNTLALAIESTADGGVVLSGYTLIETEISGVPIDPGLFVVKLDTDGTPQWTTACNTSPTTTSTPVVAVAPNGNVAVVDRFNDTINCGAGAEVSNGGTDGFVSVFDGSTGGALWMKTFGTATNQLAGDVAFDSANNVLVTGQFETSAGFPGASLSDADGKGAFVIKLGADGQLLWAKPLGGAGDQLSGRISVGADGSSVVIGQFDSTLDLPGGGNLVGSSPSNHYAIKLNASGVVQWSRMFGSTGAFIFGNRALAGGDVLISGAFASSLDLAGVSLQASAPLEVFVARLKGADGSVAWHRLAGGTSSPLVAAATDAGGFAVIAGTAFGALDFGNGPLVAAGEDLFLAKLKQ